MFTRIILIVTVLMLGGCRDEPSSSKSAEAARIEREVKRRVEVVEKGLKVRQTRLHTIRTTAFVLLAGGSIALLVWLQRQHGLHPTSTSERLAPVTRWLDHYAVSSSARVIETHPPEPQEGQRRNHSPSQATRNTPSPNRRRNRHAPKTRP
ncbi:MAG: hypothetical protein RLZZ214_3962 [Verrucomicrobiota bacterium]|jgi:hypothetical protein